jgi:hypothetical protein
MIGCAMVARALLVRRNKGKLADMTGPGEDAIRAAFRTQADFCRASGSPLTATILTALADTLDHETRTGAAILGWSGDPMVDALKLRIAGGLNALARSGEDSALSALYAAREGDFVGQIGRVIRQWDDWLLPWLDGPPQTNEVARASALYPGMMAVAARFGSDVELLELGSSAGLNLNLDRFGYDLGGVKAGDPASALQLKPDWEGPPPPFAPVKMVSRAGIDQNPLYVSEPEIAERLLAYVWPDQHARVARAEAAIGLARACPPPIEQGDAAEWLEARLAIPQVEGTARIVFHSIVLQYLTPEGRKRVATALEKAGERATESRPLAWLSMEFHARVPMAELRLTTWPDGNMQILADVHPHGAVIRWRG